MMYFQKRGSDKRGELEGSLMETEKRWYRRSLFIEGVAFLLLGLVGVFTPVLLTFAIELLIGSLFLVGGIFQGWRAFTAKKLPGFWPSILSAILYVVVGGFLLFYPIKGVVTLTFLLAFFFFLEGIFQIAFASVLRTTQSWIWVLINGILALILAALIWSGWPGTSFWVIGLLVGINLIFYGSSRIFLSRTY